MSRRVFELLGLVMSSADDSILPDDHTADRYFILFIRLLRLQKSKAHPIFVGLGEGIVGIHVKAGVGVFVESVEFIE